MKHRSFESLAALGLAFAHGHEVQPTSNLTQVLWFRFESRLGQHSFTPSITYYWLEDAQGQVHAFRLSARANSSGRRMRREGRRPASGHWLPVSPEQC